MSDRFDVLVVGGGHAGCEAAAAAARMGRRVAMVVFDRRHVGRLSCNPAIGGLAKGGLVRELDALGGLMARAADATTVQFRLLNTSRGLAVRSSRAQVDVAAYPREVQALLAALPGLRVIEGEAVALVVEGGRVAGLELAGGERLAAPRVILTTGTFLGARMHQGEVQTPGGRVGERAASRLSAQLRALGLRLGRLKTGTPPRVARDSVDWGRLEVQEDHEGRLSFSDVPRRLAPLTCHLTWTGPRAHALIRDSVHRSPMFSGAIQGVGPRYCPSVEDKVLRFPDRERHLLFLEPEGHGTDRVYINGLSTSLPAEVQEAVLRTIPGLERARVLQHGYAVEYDFADPRDLDAGLEHEGLPGLHLAGQVNGTSGYEEAAVQGFVAGVSAARGEPLALGRDEAYIGVLIDDLITRGVGGEPYRMFSSRAEHRLLLREDNADRRLRPLGRALGLVDDADHAAFEAKMAGIEAARSALAARRVVPDAETLARLRPLGVDGLKRPLLAEELLRRPELPYAALAEALDLPRLDAEQAEQVETDLRYAGYIEREQARAERARRLRGHSLEGLDLAGLPGLSNEVRERLLRHRPATLDAASRLPGVTPAAITHLALLLEARCSP